MRTRILIAAMAAAALAACSSNSTSSTGSSGSTGTTSDSGSTGSTASTTGTSASTTGTSASTTSGTTSSGTTTGTNAGTTTGNTNSGTTGTTASTTSGTTSAGGFSCTQANLYLGNPVWGEVGWDPNASNDSPADRPADGADALTGIPYHYQDIRFYQGQILTHSQQSVWRVDSSNKLHPIAGNETAASALQAGPCSSALFGDVLGFALGSDGSLYLSDWGANAILKVSNPLDPSSCTVSYLAGTNTDMSSIDLANPPNQGNADGTGAAASFNGPEFMTIDASDNLYVWDSDNSAIRKVTSAGVVTTLVTFPASTFAYAELAFLNGKVYLWGRGNDPSTDADIGLLYAIDASAGTSSPTPMLTITGDMVGADPTASWDIGGIATDGTALFIIADGQLFRITTTGQMSSSLAGVDSQSFGLDFTSGYGWNTTQPANQVELLALDQTQTWGVYSYLTLDSTGNVYFTAESEDAYVEKISCTE